AGLEPVVLRQPELLQRRAAQVAPAVAEGAAHRDEGAQTGLLALRERAVIAREEAVERRRSDERRLVGLERQPVVSGRQRLRIPGEHGAEPLRVAELAQPGECSLARGKAERAGE